MALQVKSRTSKQAASVRPPARADRPSKPLRDAVDSLLKLGANHLKDGRGRYRFHSPNGNPSAPELCGMFGKRFKERLSNWRTALPKPDTPGVQKRRTNDLIAIFSGKCDWVEKAFQPVYAELIAFWKTKDVDTVIAELNQLLDTIENVLSTRAHESGSSALRTAFMELASLSAETVVQAREAGRVDEPEIRVFQSDPPIGRDIELSQAIADLKTHRVLVLCGAPGQGKTALARYIALTVAGDYSTGVYEVDLESERNIENLPRLIGSKLRHADAPHPYELLKETSSLLILDGFDSILMGSDRETLNRSMSLLLDALRRDSRAIITCQTRLVREDGFATREVMPLAREHAVALFHTFSDSWYRQEENDELESLVVDDLAAHPLSIKIMSRYGSDLNLPVSELRRLWKEKWREVADQTPWYDSKGLKAAFELSYGGMSDSERLMFLALALLPDGMTAELIKDVWPEHETSKYHDLRALRNKCLLGDPAPARLAGPAPIPLGRLSGPLFLFADMKRKDLEASAQDPSLTEKRRWSASIDAYFDRYILKNAPQQSDADPRQKNESLRAQFHNIHASLDRRLDPSTKPATIAAANSVLLLYWAYHNNLSGAKNPISSTEDATAYLRKAMNVFLANRMRGEELRCRFYLGNIHWLRGDIQGAEKYLKDIETSVDADKRMQCDARRAAAHIEYKQGSIPKSVELYKQVILDAKLAEHDPCVLRAYVGLIDAYRKLELFDLGVAAYKAIEDRVGSDVGGLRGNAMRGYAYVLAEMGQLDAAQKQYELALLEFKANDFGQAHCLRGLGDILTRRRSFQEAKVAFGAAMERYGEAKKTRCLGVGLVFLGRARLALATSEHGEAIQWCRKAVDLFEPQDQNEPFELGVAHELAGDVHRKVADLDEARASYEIARVHFGKVGAERGAARVISKVRDLQ